MRRFALLAAVLAVLLEACCCATNQAPVTGRNQMILISPEQELQLGLEGYNDALKDKSLCGDPSANEVVKRVGRSIADVSGQGKWAWEFRLIDDPKTVNAFALPGGKVAVYSGLLNPVENEAALAAVLGHEVGHATAHHGAERISQALLLQMGLAVADVSLKDNKQHDAILASLGVAGALGISLPFSREQESEADLIGLVYMAKAGYDPSDAVAFWERMEQATKGKEMPGFLSDHPANADRVRALRNALPRAQPLYDQAQTRRGHGVAIATPGHC